MRFFTKRKNNLIKKAAFGSALLYVSAFALFIPSGKTYAHNSDIKPVEWNDSSLTSRSVFETIHCSALEILPISTRLDMLDYWDIDSVYKASNVMEGLSWLEAITPDYLKVRITPVSTLEIKILPGKKEKFVMTVYTVGDDTQSQDSQIKFYSQSLTPIDESKYLTLPKVKDFFDIPKGSATKMKEIEEWIPFPTIAFNASPNNNDLEGRLTVEQYINQDDWNIAKLFVKPYITFKWEKDKYKLEK